MSDLIQGGGIIFWVIAACGFVGIALFIERALHLHRAKIRVDDFLKGICNILRKGSVAEAMDICEETPGPVSYLVKTAVMHRDDSPEGLRAAVDEAGRSEIARMERKLVGIATIAQTAPLLGLLGTVIGMIRALLAMRQQAPLVQSGDMVAGLLQALVLTAAGLTVAIPCYVGYNFLASRVEKIVLDMERGASEILAFFAGDKSLVE
jgi:biopolymer transport protein ExbB